MMATGDSGEARILGGGQRLRKHLDAALQISPVLHLRDGQIHLEVDVRQAFRVIKNDRPLIRLVGLG